MDSFLTIDDYIHSFPMKVQNQLRILRKIITEEIPGVEEAMAYKMPTFKLHGKSVIYFAAWKHHISLYPFSTDMEKAFPESKEYKTSGKGTIQFPYEKDLPIPLIRSIVKFRLKEVKKSD